MTRPRPKTIPRPEGFQTLSPLDLNKTRVGLSHTILTPTLLSTGPDSDHGTSIRTTMTK